jgi:hypothetical protein
MVSWHGPAGVAGVLVVLGALWLTTRLFARRGISAVSGPVVSSPAVSSPVASSPVVSGPFLLAALAWLLCVEAATAIWYRIGDQRSVQNQTWSIKWPTEASGYRENPVTKTAFEMLRYDSARSAAWQDEAGNQWGLISSRWGPGNKNSFIGRGHTPDQCFTAAGWRLCSEPAPVRLIANGIDLPCRRYVFEVGGSTAYVFLALWDERSPGGLQELPLAYGLARRLKAVIQGKRHQGLKKLEISLIGPASPEEAVRVLRKELERLIIL